MRREHLIGTGLGLLTPALLLLIVGFKIEELRVWLCCFSASLFLIGIALIIYGKKTKRAVSMQVDYEEIQKRLTTSCIGRDRCSMNPKHRGSAGPGQ